MMLKLVTTKVLLMLFAEQCFLQEVPGLAYIDILRTSPRKRIEGAAPDPALPEVPVQPEINRRYDVMLDYDYDYLDGEDSGEVQQKTNLVATTLERPQHTEALLSTDLSDYVLFNIGSGEEDDTELAKLPSVTLTYGQDFLPTDSQLSHSSVSEMQLPLVNTVNQDHKIVSQESAHYVTAVRVPSYSEEFLNDGHTLGEHIPQESSDSFGSPYNDFTGTGYYPVIRNLPEAYPQYTYSGDYPVSLLKEEDPASQDYYQPATFYEYEDIVTTSLPSESYLGENITNDDELIAILATSSQNYPSYSPNNYPPEDSTTGERPRALSDNYSRSRVYGRKVNSGRESSNFATRVGKQITSPTKIENVPSHVDKQNQEEIAYYTELQKEIEKSSLLLDAIKDVRTREGNTIVKAKTKVKTTAITPPPSISSIKRAFKAHPLYTHLPGVTGDSEEISKTIVQREYENEEDEYENMYLPARAKSLELSEIDEVREHFNTLVPKAAYKSSDFARYPSYPGQHIYMPPVTTYKPSQIQKYNKKLKPSTLSPAKLPVEHRNKHLQKHVSPSYITKHQKPHSPQFYRPSGNQYSAEPYSSSKTINPSTLDRSTRSYRSLSAPTKTYNKIYTYIPVSTLGHTGATTKPDYKSTSSTLHYATSQIKPVTRHNSRQPSETFYENVGRPHRPHVEDLVRDKRGRNMEFAIDSNARFPRYGYNIDRFFDDFPAFGFFDYDPSRKLQ